METLYHPEIFMPEWFTAPTERVTLKWSKHALRAGMNDRYGVIPVFKSIPLSKFKVVEIAAADGVCTKIVVRGRYDDERDVVFVLIPGTHHHFVKTVWFNKRTDKHKTLKRERYAVA